MNLHREIHFEEPICHYPGSHGWIYVEGDAARYDGSQKGKRGSVKFIRGPAP
jgi:hypothetical protein